MINSVVKERLLFICMVCFVCWQSFAAILGFVIYWFIKYYKIPKIYTLVLSSILLVLCILNFMLLDRQTFLAIVINSYKFNLIFWKLLFSNNCFLAFYYLLRCDWPYLFGLPLMIGTILYFIDAMSSSGHADTMKEIINNRMPLALKYNPQRLQKTLRKMKDEDVDGILLGASLTTGKAVVMPDSFVNQIVLVLGTTGAGKTITLRRFLQRAILKGYPLIIVDGKPTADNIDYVSRLAEKGGKTFYGFNCATHNFYNPFSHGGYTELKDKIITLKDQWDNDYYRTVASDYLQTAIEVLLVSGVQINLRTIANCLDFENLTVLLRQYNNSDLIEKVKPLENYERNALTGLQAHLNLISNSELGKYFDTNENSFGLMDVINNSAVAYFALPALRFPDFAKTLGKLIINDIKAVIEPLESKVPIFVIFDEFSVFAGDQVLNLINMGRGKGLHTVLGTQGLADLRRVDTEFESQLLNCVNSIICHRLNHQESAESISKWIGTQDTYDLTTQIDLKCGSVLGSASRNKAFIVHPDEIKQYLKVGEAFYMSKIDTFHVNKLKIKSI